MMCPSCNQERSKVTNSRKNGNEIKRLRECQSCGFSWHTVEIDPMNYVNYRRKQFFQSDEKKKGQKYRPIVTVLKQKKGVPTVLLVSGRRYQLQHPDQYKRG